MIALFYTEDLAVGPLAVAALGVAAMFGLRWLNVWRGPAYLVHAIAAWVALHLSGGHPTLLGVAIALSTPAYPPRREEVDDGNQRTRAYIQSLIRSSPEPRFLTELGMSEADLPVIVCQSGRVLRNPDDTELTRALQDERSPPSYRQRSNSREPIKNRSSYREQAHAREQRL